MKLILDLDGLCALSVSFQFHPQKSIFNSIAATITENDSFFSLFNLSDEVSSDDMNELNSLLLKFRDIYSTSEFYLGKTDAVSHLIETGNLLPVHTNQYRLPHSQKA